MKRITDANLEAVCARINRLTASPLTPYTDNKPNIGAFLINHQYGRVQLARIACPRGRNGDDAGFSTRKLRVQVPPGVLDRLRLAVGEQATPPTLGVGDRRFDSCRPDRLYDDAR